MQRFQIRPTGGRWQTVSRSRFAQAERDAGFRPKRRGDLATAGFSGNGVEGRIVKTERRPGKGSGRGGTPYFDEEFELPEDCFKS